MLFTHIISNQKISKNVSRAVSLLATNNIGGYLWLSDNAIYSRYQGWFVNIDNGLYKILDAIRIKNTQEILEIRNIIDKDGEHYLQRVWQNNKETFLLKKYRKLLFYSISQEAEIELVLDIRKSYSNPQWGRNYQIYKKGNFLVVRYKEGLMNQKVFLVISLANIKSYEKVDRWFKKSYKFDKQRNSPPYEMYVYHALNLKTDRLIMAAGKTEKEAVTTIENRSASIKSILCLEKKVPINNDYKKTDIALSLAEKSLESLLVYSDTKRIKGLYAGLPWFFQFWSRDESISLRGLAYIDKKKACELSELILCSSQKDGQLPAIRGSHDNPSFMSADALGWAVFHWYSFNQNTTKTTKKKTKEIICSFIDKLLQFHTDKEGLATNNGLETWMDTGKEKNDARSGARIEIQALRLNLYRTAYDLTGDKKYRDLEANLLRQTRKYFWQGRYLKDGKNDETIRPNVFLVYYIYPELLSKKEWITCFDYILKCLWLDWGGISTIDKKSPLFIDCHTGEENSSYHRGDSWFWLNNLAALCMLRLDKRRYQTKIEKIFKASTKNLLWYGAVGHCSELSSAKKFEPAGSPVQAWSAATYIELLTLMTRIRTNKH